ncbi:MAG TPA: DUF1080 domain-containing protein [Gemmataceae bacterium]|nr:DUF1080 domain-containing protein [Gemmataceae bacterium]
MRGIVGVIVVAGLSLGASQGDQGKLNSLTPKEATDGWLLLFDGETPYGWTATMPGKLTAQNANLRFEGAGSFQTNTAFPEYALQFQCRITAAQAHEDVRLNFRNTTVKFALPNDKFTGWKTAKLLVTGKRYKFTMTAGSTDFPVVDGELADLLAGPISFTVAKGVSLEIRNVILMPLGQKPLFNGKNLDGWHEFKGAKYVSKFSVNDKLELNVKNGPGDLQTDGKYADFLLQLDCLSNGKHLNSGVFFRCKPNEYQNGYECQIHNGWNAQADKVYSLDHFDPMTHKLLKTEKIKSAAIDGGTGGIYRRIPARKQVAKDFEWFTLTLAAHGNHIATWVNGIQVCDWTDNRAANVNPRNGCRLEAGHISIQGHDPTTDLSFRKIRIADYLAAEKK